ncbi:MAG: TIGR04211 family SH3 domain-containing protein [Amphritea sp.]|nr:TIGR04211 family SH3 domain-containing protein [Amphritea sp.]
MNPFSKLPKFFIPALTALLLVFGLQINASAANYISDDVYTFYHGGPGNQYKITGRIRSGTPVTVLRRNNEAKYVQIRTPSGKTGWIGADKVSSGTSLTIRFPELQQQLEASQQQVTTQADEINTLKQQSGSLGQENNRNAMKIAELEEQIVALNRTINSMDESNLMRWFTYGGLVAFGGLILGLIIPFLPKRRKRRDTW